MRVTAGFAPAVAPEAELVGEGNVSPPDRRTLLSSRRRHKVLNGTGLDGRRTDGTAPRSFSAKLG